MVGDGTQSGGGVKINDDLDSMNVSLACPLTLTSSLLDIIFALYDETKYFSVYIFIWLVLEFRCTLVISVTKSYFPL